VVGTPERLALLIQDGHLLAFRRQLLVIDEVGGRATWCGAPGAVPRRAAPLPLRPLLHTAGHACPACCSPAPAAAAPPLQGFPSCRRRCRWTSCCTPATSRPCSSSPAAWASRCRSRGRRCWCRPPWAQRWCSAPAAGAPATRSATCRLAKRW
jgi:hypothetical protein